MTFNYAALTDTIEIEDITSNTHNQIILQQLKDNDESFDKLYIMDSDSGEDDEYITKDGEDIGWLGYFIGQNTKLKCLYFHDKINDESFYKEMSCNKSIKEIHFNEESLLDGNMIRMLGPFLQNNHNLSRITLDECEFGIEDGRQLSLAIGSCSKSLKHIEITNNEMVDGQLVEIITALSIHPQLTKLCLVNNGPTIGRNECTALSTLLRHTTTQLETLNLNCNYIDDEKLEVLVNTLTNVNTLKELDLGCNRPTLNGWKRVVSLLELPESTLKKLFVSYNNNIGDEGALVFANALTNNSTLEHLYLTNCGVTDDGWTPFSKLLCNTSSVNNTYTSNHTLLTILGMPRRYKQLLDLNRSYQNKQQVAMLKILQHHYHFDVQPFFEWEFKVLPIMIEWFTKASTRLDVSFVDKINKMKLSVIHDFVKEFPMLYIEPVTRKEIAECTAVEEELQGGDAIGREQDVRLEEIRQRKARALRRL